MNSIENIGLSRTLPVAAGQDITVRVPATSANLGPGFDSLGLALGLYDTVRVRTTDDEGIRVAVRGEGEATVPLDESHLVVRTICSTLDRCGSAVRGLSVEAQNAIPHGRGLGSSAAAIVSGVLAANALLPEAGRLDDAAVLDLCSALEGHPDNVAPALAGNLAISWEDAGTYSSAGVRIHPDVVALVAIPAEELSTERARGLLPAVVPHAAAAANSGRAALLVHALTADPSLLFPGTRDSLHQDYRAEAMRPSAGLLHHLRSLGYAATISGAGPTVLCLANGAAQAEAAERAITECLQGTGSSGNWRVLRLGVDVDGARVLVHQR